MNKYTMNKPLSIDDVHYTKSVLLDYVKGDLTFEQLLEVLPAEVNLAKLMVLLSEQHDDKLTINASELIINHYYNRLKEVKNYNEEKYLKKLLTTKEVFFLTDHLELQKLVDGKDIDIAEEVRVAFNPVRDKIQDLLKAKVLGSSSTKLVFMVKPYSAIFIRNKYLKQTPGIVSSSGEIKYVSNEMINQAEQFLTENDLFPARVPTEKYLFKLCREQLDKEEEIEK